MPTHFTPHALPISLPAYFIRCLWLYILLPTTVSFLFFFLHIPLPRSSLLPYFTPHAIAARTSHSPLLSSCNFFSLHPPPPPLTSFYSFFFFSSSSSSFFFYFFFVFSFDKILRSSRVLKPSTRYEGYTWSIPNGAWNYAYNMQVVEGEVWHNLHETVADLVENLYWFISLCYSAS